MSSCDLNSPLFYINSSLTTPQNDFLALNHGNLCIPCLKSQYFEIRNIAFFRCLVFSVLQTERNKKLSPPDSSNTPNRIPRISEFSKSHSWDFRFQENAPQRLLAGKKVEIPISSDRISSSPPVSIRSGSKDVHSRAESLVVILRYSDCSYLVSCRFWRFFSFQTLRNSNSNKQNRPIREKTRGFVSLNRLVRIWSAPSSSAAAVVPTSLVINQTIPPIRSPRSVAESPFPND
jgi:hypothetical protein